MIINLESILKAIDGTPLKDRGDVEGTFHKVTLRKVAVNAILDPNEKVDGEEKVKRFNLALKLQNAGSDVELSVDDVKLIKDKVGELYPPLVVGQAWELLDPKKKKKTGEKDVD